MNMKAEKELELINRHTRSPLSSEDIYIFTVTLCDNEVDRDFERFSTEALVTLGELFVGKTGISDHSMSSRDQRARIFRTYIEKSQTEKTSCGENYTALKARAYMLRTEENASLIKEIEGGIKKEVSIGCAMSECICSLCGKDMKKHLCEHTKGKSYAGKLCHGILKSPTDAYEWSFVAVPAQRNAGVTKSFTGKEEKITMTIEKFKSLSEDTLITAEEMESLKAHISSLESLASEGKAYREQLTAEIRKYALIIMPDVNISAFIKGCKSMDIREVKDLCHSLRAQANGRIPLSPQLAPVKETSDSDNSDFRI
ncbi:MAG: hypothetical protein E7543_06845 [Ruminococcaceae bacterium]|nr:hypothetical protein [Oscillospiraceae bacterium]